MIVYTLPMTAISQLQMSYSPEEDRVLLRLNTTSTEEFRFWLTRRYSQLVIQALRCASSQLTPMSQTRYRRWPARQLRSLSRRPRIPGETSKMTSSPVRPFPWEKPRYWPIKLSYKVSASKLALTIAPKSGQGVTIVLDSSLNFNVTKLLKSAGEAGKWGLDWRANSRVMLLPRKNTDH